LHPIDQEAYVGIPMCTQRHRPGPQTSSTRTTHGMQPQSAFPESTFRGKTRELRLQGKASNLQRGKTTLRYRSSTGSDHDLQVTATVAPSQRIPGQVHENADVVSTSVDIQVCVNTPIYGSRHRSCAATAAITVVPQYHKPQRALERLRVQPTTTTCFALARTTSLAS